MPRTSIQRAVAWIVCAGFVLLGLMYLHGAAYSAWVSGGPPNDHPLGWQRRAIGQLGLSAAAFVLGMGSYKLVRSLPTWPRSALVLLCIGVALASTPGMGRYVLRAMCQDAGGVWHADFLECVHVPK